LDLTVIRRGGHPVPAIEEVIEKYMKEQHACLPHSYHGHNELRKRDISCSHIKQLDKLTIGHSHSHWDHTAGDSEFLNFTSSFIKDTVLIPPSNVTALQTAYAIKKWPTDIGKVDLGTRILDIIPLPGHDPTAIAIYDRQTGLLLTGDSVYPGRLYIPKIYFQDYKDSHQRLQKFVEGKEVSWVLGCHVEQKKTPFEEYPSETRWQPEEHVLQLPASILDDVEEGLKTLDGSFGQTMFAEFSLVVLDRAEA
jgi:hydroxyacylglutathione hydrolase